MKIESNKFVTLMYKLEVKEENGAMELMEETTAEQPLKYFHGLGMMLPKFEEKMEGLAAGDKFEFMLKAEEAYGEYSDDEIVDLPRNIFEIDGKIDEEKVFEGAIVPLVDNEGNRINAEIVEIKTEAVKVDFNHPLAGEDLYFSGNIVAVETPSEEELNKIMNHAGGCSGGSCSSCSCDGGCGGCC